MSVSPWHVFHMCAVDHHDFQSGLLQHFVDHQPIHARGFHGHRRHTLRFQKIAQRTKRVGHGVKHLNGTFVNGDVHPFTAHINRRDSANSG